MCKTSKSGWQNPFDGEEPPMTGFIVGHGSSHQVHRAQIPRCFGRTADVMADFAEGLSLAQRRSSAAAGSRSAYRRLTDLRGSMSGHRRIPDVAPSGSEGRFMTQSVNREFFGLDRFSLVSPPYPGLETIRIHTLPSRSPISGYRRHSHVLQPSADLSAYAMLLPLKLG